MKDKRLVLVHTVSPLLAVFNQLVAEVLPGVRLLHVLDEPLLEQVRQRGHLEPDDSARLQTHVLAAEKIGADVVLVTCSTVSPCVDDVRHEVDIPVIKIDEAMVTEAVSRGTKIGVVATNVTTLEPTRQLLEAQATAASKEIEVELMLVENGLAALLSGDGARHDNLVKDAVLELSNRVDVVVLAQATMARALDVIPTADCPVPILSSPYLALERVRELLEAPGQ